MPQFNIYGLINLVGIVLTLVAMGCFYKILLRTKKTLHKGLLFLFWAIVMFTIIYVLKLVGYNQPLVIEVLCLFFLLLIVIGLWNLQRCVMEVDGELGRKGNLKIKKKKKGLIKIFK